MAQILPRGKRETNSPEETFLLAREIGSEVQGGEIFALIGDLGAGKTLFVQGLAKGLEVPEEVYVASPTFTLLDTYPGRLTLHHLDLYRLGDIDELELIGWRDCLNDDSVVAIEWADKMLQYLPPERTIAVKITFKSAESRIIEWTPLSELKK